MWTDIIETWSSWQTVGKVFFCLYCIPLVLGLLFGIIYSVGQYKLKKSVDGDFFGISFIPLMNVVILSCIFDDAFIVGLRVIRNYIVNKLSNDYVLAFVPVLALGLVGFLI